jgi:transposase InsO family protein
MAQVLHGSATTTHAIRAAIQRSKAPIAAVAERYGVNRKTVMKWRAREGLDDAPMGPKQPRSTVLTPEQEAVAVAFRKHTLLALDDCLYALQATIPHLTRSSLHRLFQRHDISRLPSIDGEKPKQRFKAYPIGFFHIDIAEVHTGQGRLYLFVAIDRTSKFVFVELHEKATRRVAADFLRRLIEAVPYKVHTVLTDNGTHFTSPGNAASAAQDIKQAIERGEPLRAHAFEYACARNDIDHRLTKPCHPWTNGQVERMNRTIKEATVRAYHYETHEQLRDHLAAFIAAYNFAKRLKALGGKTPFEAIVDAWTKNPNRFRLSPNHLTSGLNT